MGDLDILLCKDDKFGGPDTIKQCIWIRLIMWIHSEPSKTTLNIISYGHSCTGFISHTVGVLNESRKSVLR